VYTSAGTLAAGDYTKKTVDMALSKRDFCMGFISTSRLTEVCRIKKMKKIIKKNQARRERENERERERERERCR